VVLVAVFVVHATHLLPVLVELDVLDAQEMVTLLFALEDAALARLEHSIPNEAYLKQKQRQILKLMIKLLLLDLRGALLKIKILSFDMIL